MSAFERPCYTELKTEKILNMFIHSKEITKNNVRGITMGIGSICKIRSLAPSSSLEHVQ